MSSEGALLLLVVMILGVCVIAGVGVELHHVVAHALQGRP